MRQRERLLQSLESVFKEAYRAARERDDAEDMARLDFEYQREQIHLEVLLDIRDLLGASPVVEKGGSLIEKAQAIKQLTKLR
ncbi:MAG TPA: hypothetical protein VJ997_09935 [Longimicrobiales bacterium]|nr:hypothetical protein [Longimicrobiales bacterium]